MSDADLAKKLLLKPGSSFLLLGAPAEYRASLASASENVEQSENSGGRQFDLVQWFVRDQAELQAHLTDAIAAVKPGGIFWITYPKQTGAIRKDLNRDHVWKLVEPTGWRPVTAIAVDDTWSALRFRPVADVGTAKQDRRGGPAKPLSSS
jgi:hypothetical protein